MSCSLQALALCFSMQGFYVDVAVGVQDNGVERYYDVRSSYTRDVGGAVKNGWTHAAWSSHETTNPYGCLELGHKAQLSQRVTASLAGRHCSSLATSRDRGQNSVLLSLRWHPWGSR